MDKGSPINVKWLLLPMAIATSGCIAGPIPLVGFDKVGNLFERGISRNQYETTLREGVDGVQEGVVETLEGSPIIEKLQEIRIGLGVKGQFGIGDYLSIEGNVGIRLCFQKVEDSL